MSKEVIIIGCGGHGKVIEDIIKSAGDRVYGFLDDDNSKDGVIGKICDCRKYKDKYFVIGIGNNFVRKEIAEKYSALKYYTAIHPSAVISESAKINTGTVVMANAVVNANVFIGQHCIVNTTAVVEHDTKLENYVHISPGAVLCGTVQIGEMTQIGAGAIVKNNVSVCARTVIGAGGTVIHNITEEGIYIGVPVKQIR